jgi:hypothetical protein
MDGKLWAHGSAGWPGDAGHAAKAAIAEGSPVSFRCADSGAAIVDERGGAGHVGVSRWTVSVALGDDGPEAQMALRAVTVKV